MQIYSKFSNFNNINQAKAINNVRQIAFKGDLSKESQYIGCILGGAIGDAMGAPVEFLSEEQIKRLYGEQGVLAPMIGMFRDYITRSGNVLFVLFFQSLNFSSQIPDSFGQF